MKVCVAIPCLNRGGTEMQTLYLVRALKLSGHVVEVVCYFQYDTVVVGEFEASECTVTLMNLDRKAGAFATTRSLRTYFASRRPDVVHVQYMAPGALPILAARLAGVRRVFATVHQPYTKSHGVHAMVLLRSAALMCDHFIAVSEVAEKSWFGGSGGNASGTFDRYPQHFTLHNAVDVEMVSGLASVSKHTSLGLNGLVSYFIFGYVGRLRHEKGVDILFEAFAKVSGTHEEARLLVVGDGPDLPFLKERFGREPWWRNVLFTGEQSWEEAMKYFSLMDTVVVPSRFEGFGLTAVEAMASSLPVIASRTGGLGEIVCHGESGLLFENGNVKELEQAMELLLGDSAMRERLSFNAKKRAEFFDIRLYNERIISFYNSLE